MINSVSQRLDKIGLFQNNFNPNNLLNSRNPNKSYIMHQHSRSGSLENLNNTTDPYIDSINHRALKLKKKNIERFEKAVQNKEMLSEIQREF